RTGCSGVRSRFRRARAARSLSLSKRSAGAAARQCSRPKHPSPIFTILISIHTTYISIFLANTNLSEHSKLYQSNPFYPI
ncbi:MAG: hypothetical protein NZ522_04200, partial [Chitinophagales bacterium]|nr:hypothetical protein [Chitinophagales bacterium]